MRLTADEALERLSAHDHGVLCTVHPERGVDAVPCVFAVSDGFVGVPIDTVKAKSTTQLQRLRNLQADPRATLLVDQWDRADWSKLWWVRAELRWTHQPPSEVLHSLSELLRRRYPQYSDAPFADVLVLHVVNISGWAAV